MKILNSSVKGGGVCRRSRTPKKESKSDRKELGNKQKEGFEDGEGDVKKRIKEDTELRLEMNVCVCVCGEGGGDGSL